MLKNKLQGGEQKQEEELQMTTYYKTYNEARLHANAGDFILFDWGKGYYIVSYFVSKKDLNAGYFGRKWF